MTIAQPDLSSNTGWNAFRFVVSSLVTLALIVSALQHLTNPYEYHQRIVAYGILPRLVALVAAVVLPSLQITLGVAIVASSRHRRWALSTSAGLFAIYLSAQVWAYSHKLAISCGCFGRESDTIGFRSMAIAGACLLGSLVSLINIRNRVNASRSGISQIELIVVIAILGVLFALIAGAVGKVRSSAAKSDCQNRIRQVALGLEQYHDSHHVLPPGMSAEAGKPLYRYLGWPARILPYLDQSAIWQEVEAAYASDPNTDPQVFHGHPAHAKLLAMPVAILNCPADSRLPGPRILATDFTVAFTSYLGVQGLNPFRKDGVLFKDSEIKMNMITDGIGNTLLLGERPPSSDFRLGWWYRGWGQQQDGSAEMLLGVRERNVTRPECHGEPNHFQPGRTGNICDAFHFWSHHTNGAHFAFADGSVRFLTYSVDEFLPALASRAGGDAAEMP